MKAKIYCGVSIEKNCKIQLHPINEVTQAKSLIDLGENIESYSNSTDFVLAIKYYGEQNGYDCDFVTYIKRRKEVWKGVCNKPTLILDEIDSQLDMTSQIRFHEEILPKLLKDFQVILVSHSIFATKHDNIIDLDGTLDFVREKAKNL